MSHCPRLRTVAAWLTPHRPLPFCTATELRRRVLPAAPMVRTDVNGKRETPDLLLVPHCTLVPRLQKAFDIHRCPESVEDLAPEGFEIDDHEVILFGRCRPAPDCRTLREGDETAGAAGVGR